MKQFSKRLIAGVVGLAAFGVSGSCLALLVEYKPYGVSDRQRGEYEQKVAEIHSRQKLLKDLKDQAKPVVEVKDTIHDFGMLDPHTTAVHAFTVSNKGEHPLKLEVRDTSCKCTVGKLTNNLLGPGESTKVTMTWNTGYKADTYEQTATLITNDPLKESIQLKVKGEVRAEFVAPKRVSFTAIDPAETATAEFVVYSQLWDDFQITELKCDLEGFQWHAEPTDVDAAGLIDVDAKSAWKVTLYASRFEYGKFESDLELMASPTSGGDDVTRTIVAAGRVRAAIGFTGPNLHKTDGLDIGTLVSGKEHQFHVVVRTRDQGQRSIEVLDVQPQELTASLEPTTQEGAYRLTLTVPADCDSVVFNMGHQHGYVQVGDPKDERYSNWFPVFGAVASLENAAAKN